LARVTIDNPRKLNILSRATLAQLVVAMRDIEGKERLRAVVLTGAGEKSFVGGADLDELARAYETREPAERIARFRAQRRRIPQ